MKLYELFISERISLVKYKDLIHSAILQGVTDSVRQMFYKINKYPEEKRAQAREGNLGELEKYAHSELFKQLKVLVPVSISYAIRDELDVRLLATAKQLDSADAHASGLSIVYNELLFSKLAKYILEVLEQTIIDNYGSDDDLYQLYRDAFRTVSVNNMVEEYDRLRRSVDHLVSVTLHELTHVIQHERQIKKGRQTEYRSYLEPDKQKFYQAVARLHQSDPKDYKLYLASPQEITAFAQQTALDIVRNNYLDLDPVIRQYAKKNIGEYIETYIYRAFSDPKQPREYKIYKRFQKLVYQMVMDYIDEVDKKSASVDK